jgi:hypothetical protein
LDCLGLALISVAGFCCLLGGTWSVPEDTVLQRPDHIYRHAVLETVLTDDDLLLEKLVGDEILGPADHTHHGASDVRAGHD